MASTYLTKANPTGGDRTKGTISVWVKRSGSGSYQWIYSEHADGNHYSGIRFNNNDTLGVFSYDSGSGQIDINTNRVFRDLNSWYNIIVAWDTTDGTASDRVKIYINGVRETSFSGSPTYPTSSQSTYFAKGGAGYPIRIGTVASSQYFDGLMSHFHRVDGQALAQTVFGETDSTTGEWKIKTSPSITYTGSSDFNFFILKDGNSVTDQSGQSNNLTVGGGTLSKTEDNPSNVFATFNPLDHKSTNWNMQNGNTRLQGTGGDSWETRRAISTIGASSGKYYAELKMTTAGNDSYPFGVGYDVFELSYSSSMGSNSNFWGYYQPSGGQIYGGGTGSPLATSLGGGTGDIIGIALDIDNLTLQFYKNGSTMGSQITGLPSGKTWFFASSGYGNTNTFDCNFGNGYFGSTQISSAGTNASGNGIFEYDVPTGFTALSTKGLNL